MRLTIESRDREQSRSSDTLRRLWSSMNVTDRLFAPWYLGLGAVIALLPHRVERWWGLLLLHAVVLAVIMLLVRRQSRSRHWRFAHDWYPVLLFVAAFEETALLSFLLRNEWQDSWILELEAKLFSVPPTVWLGQQAPWWLTEILEIGYFSFYGFFLAVAGVLYARAHRSSEPVARSVEAQRAFRDLVDASVLGYIFCFIVYLLFPMEGPRHTLAYLHAATPLSGGPFHWAVETIQRYGGVHGNAFPSAHITAATVASLFATRYARSLVPWLLPLLVLMCVGAVNDRYHYVSDAVAGLLVGAAVSLLFMFRGRRRQQELQHN